MAQPPHFNDIKQLEPGQSGEFHEKLSFRDGFLGTFTTNIIASVCGVVTGVILARYLGPIGRGELAAIQNWPMFLTAFGSLGVMTAAGYYSGQRPSEAGAITFTAWIFLLLLSFPVIAIGYWLVPLVMQSQSGKVIETARILLWLVFFQFAGGVSSWAIQGMGWLKKWNMIRIQMPILWLIVIVALAYSPCRSSVCAAYGFLIISAIHNLTWVIAALFYVQGPRKINIPRLWEMLRYGLFSTLSQIPQNMNQRLDQLAMAAILPAKLLGFYVVAVVWSNVLSPLLTSVSQVIFPRLAALHDRARQGESLQGPLCLSFMVTGISVLIMLLATPFFVPLIFGPAFAPVVPVSLVLVVAAGFAGLKLLTVEALRGMGLPKCSAIAELAGFFVTVGLLVFLLPRYQLMGAAIASLGSYATTLGVCLYFISKETKVLFASLVIPRKDDFIYMRKFLGLAWRRIYPFFTTGENR